MQRIKALAAMAACACLCAALFGCAAKEPAAQEADQDRQAAAELHPDFKEPAPAQAPLRQGKDEISVLVLNGCGIEGAALEAAERYGWTKIPCLDQEGRLRRIDEIHQDIWQAVRPLLETKER